MPQPILARWAGNATVGAAVPAAGAGRVEEALAPLIRQITERLEDEAGPEERAKLLTATYILTGLRVAQPVSERLFEGVRSMKESSTYQGILAEGRAEGEIKGQLK